MTRWILLDIDNVLNTASDPPMADPVGLLGWLETHAWECRKSLQQEGPFWAFKVAHRNYMFWKGLYSLQPHRKEFRERARYVNKLLSMCPDAMIVVSSSWRYSFQPWLVMVFLAILGVRPWRLRGCCPISFSQHKPRDIGFFMADHPGDRYVILDDEHMGQHDHHAVRVSAAHGLRIGDVFRAYRILMSTDQQLRDEWEAERFR